jgi:hypothetical protein
VPVKDSVSGADIHTIADAERAKSRPDRGECERDMNRACGGGREGRGRNKLSFSAESPVVRTTTTDDGALVEFDRVICCGALLVPVF